MKIVCFFYVCLPLGLCLAADAHAADDNAPKETANGESDTDRDTASADTDSSTDTEEVVMDFPMDIDDNPYNNRKPHPPTPTSDKSQKQPVKKPTAPVPPNPPWAADSPQADESETQNAGVTFLPPPPPAPPDGTLPEMTVDAPSICHRIPCSGHGLCVVKGGEPICACNEGFVPDSAGGLNCIREQSATPPSPPTARPPQAPSWSKETYYLNLSIALGDYDIRPVKKQYEAALTNGSAEGSFATYLRGRFKRTQNFGTLAMSIGIPALAGGFALHMLYAGYPEKKGLLAGALVLDLSSALLISTGAALLATAAIHTKKLEAFERKHRRRRPRASILPPALGFTRNAALLCVGAHFF